VPTLVRQDELRASADRGKGSMASAFGYIAGSMRSERTQARIVGIALVATVAIALTGCGAAKTVVAAPKSICNTGTPPGGFEPDSSAASLKETTATVPKISGVAVDTFGKMDAQAAFQVGFSVVYNLNILGKMWAPNMNKDPKFIPSLKADLESYSPYFCGAMKAKFLQAIPYIVNPSAAHPADPTGKVKAAVTTKDVNAWRGMFALTPRLANGTLPPSSNTADDLELVAPFSFGQKIIGAPIAKIETDPFYKEFGKAISFRFTWENNLVYGTTKSIEYERSVKRDVTVIMVKNPDAISAKDFPYVIVDFSSRPVTLKGNFGPMIKHHAPLVQAPPA